MSDTYLRLLDQDPQQPAPRPTPTPPREASVYDQLLDREEQQRDRQLAQSVASAIQRDPATAGQAQQMFGQTGVPVDVIERNMPAIKREIQRKRVEDMRRAQSDPILLRQMEDPEFAALALTDLDNASVLERIGRGFEAGGLNVDRLRIREAQRTGTATLNDEEQLRAIDKRLAELGEPEGWSGVPAAIAGGLTRTVPQVLASGATAASIAAVGGQLGPQALAPEEVFTVPVAFGIGAAMEMYRQGSQLGRGEFYDDAMRAGLDEARVNQIAPYVGALYGLLDVVGAETALGPVRREITKRITKEIIEGIAAPTLGKAVGKRALDYAVGVGGEAGTETLQKVVQIVGQEVGGRDRLGTAEGRAAIASEIANEFLTAVQGMAVLGAPGPAFSLYMDRQRLAASETQQQTVQALARNAAESQVRKDNPDQYRKHVDAQLAGTGAETTYIDAQKFAEVFAQSEREAAGKSETPRALLEAKVPGVLQQAEAALLTGGDVTMPTSDWAAHVADTDLGKALQPHVRLDAEALSMEEIEAAQTDDAATAEEAGKALDEQQAAAEKWQEEAQGVEKTIRDELVGAGMKPQEAQRNAAMWRAFVETQADRVGETPAAFFGKYRLKVQKGEAQEGALTKGDRGFFDPKTLTITLTPDADGSTFVHESGHAFLSIYADLATQKAHPVLVDDFAAFLKWTGVESVEAWNALSLDQQRKHHEAFAANFEEYLFTGAAPEPGLKRLFHQLARFIKRVYRNIREQLSGAHREQFGEDLPALSPEIRLVMDRMLASEDQVAVAQAVRGAVPQFQTQEESGLDDAAWQKYQAEQWNADSEAIGDVTRSSLRDMQWLGRAKGTMLRKIQAKAARVREGVRQQVAAEAQGEPVHRAIRWLKTGEMVNQDGTKTQGDRDQNHKLRTESVPEEFRDRLAGMTRQDGLDPDMVAGVFGFDSGLGMVEAIAAANLGQAIETRTDARMLAEHAELADRRRVDATIDAALHNEARRRFVAGELAILTKRPTRIEMGAAKLAAETALGRRRVNELGARGFTAATRKASQQAQEAAQSGNARETILAKRRHLVQEQMADLAADARKEVARGEALFEKFQESDEKIGKSREIDLVHAARSLAAAYGLGPQVATEQQRVQRQAAIARLRAEWPMLAERLDPLLQQPGDYQKLTLNQLREVVEVAEWLWEQARAEKLLDAQGKKIEKDKAVGELLGGMGQLPPTSGPDGITPSPGRRDMIVGWSAFASLKRAEHWARWMDSGKDDGPFQRYFVSSIQRATQQYRAAQAETIRRYDEQLTKLMEASGPLWHARIEANEIGYTFRGKKELVGALLHIGNESNLQRLLLNRVGRDGRAWGEILPDGTFDSSRWDSFVARAFEAGLITKADLEFVRFVWKEYAKLLPAAQKAHKAMHGSEFETVPLRPVATPFGTLEGGYAPAMADPDMMAPQGRETAEQSIEGVTRDALFSLPTNKNFTMQRSDNPNTGRPLALDLGKQLAAFDQELRFIHLMPAVRDALRLLRDPRFKTALDAYDRDARAGILMPYLDNVARQSATRSTGIRAVDAGLAFMERASSVQALGWSLKNALVQVTGLGPTRHEIGARWTRAGVKQFWRNPARALHEARERSLWMTQRFDTESRRMRDRIAGAVDSGMLAGWRATKRTVARWTFVLQHYTQMVVDLATWHGAYQKAIADGKVDTEAAEYADGVVRRTQGSQNPEDHAAYRQNVIGRLLGEFGSYGNLSLNRIVFAQGKASALLWTMLVPVIVEGAIATALQGGPDDKDDDEDDTIEEWAKVFGRNAVRNVTGMIPGGSMLTSIVESEGSRTQVPVVSAFAQSVRGASEMVEAFTADGETTEAEVNAIAAFLSTAFQLPIAAPVRQVQAFTGER